MNDGQISEISEAIGQLRAQVQIGRENDMQIMRTLSEINGKLSGLPTMRASIESVTARVDAIEPEIEKVKKARWFGIGAASVTGIGAGVGGAGVWRTLQKLFDIGG